MSSLANNRNGGMLITRNERSMPKWVTEQSDRIGPRPPPPPLTPENGHAPAKQPSLPPKTKSQPEPDYEVIEFSNQQYSNAPLRPNSASSGSKTPDNKLKCTLCGSGNPWVTCEECAQQIFCASCDDMFHKHPKRKDHQRKTIEKSRPPIPPKTLPGQPGPTPPVAPPRRNKRGLMTPIMQRKDQGNAMPAPFPVPPSPTPSMKNASWQERFGSLPRGLNLLNRPLPETPKTPSESSRSTTPKSVFDNIQRPPSVALEKIKSKANATLDRMQLLQQRYRQQKEQMERERSGSVTDQRQMALQHHQMAVQRANQLGQRGMSSSVFNLNQINRKQNVTNNGWMNNPMQQAQSMAQLNCANCAQQQSQWNGPNQHHMHMHQDPWSNQLSSQQHLNRSNMSLNVPAGYMMQPHMNGMYPPPTFMNQRGFQQMYPQPYMGGMPVMNPGLIGMPPSTSRAASRAGSRMASPAMSRKSVTLRRKQRSSYIDDEATDDEDSDEDDRRSITSARSGVSRTRQRRMSSASQFPLDDDIELSQSKAHRNRARNQRRDSIAKSVHNDWAPGRGTSSSNNNNRSADSGFNSPLKPSRIYSDLDSEGSGTRALVQAKIEQKLKEENLKQKSSKPKRQSQSPTPQKTSAAVQTPAVKQTTKQEIIEKVVDEPVKQERQPSASESEEEQQPIKKEQQPLEVEEKQECATEEEEETKSEESEESEAEQEQETEQIEVNEIEEDDLGPPPSTPDHEWECEFCTFVNEANIKICSICCKTPSIKPKKAIKSISPPKQIKTPLVKKEKGHAKEKENEKETVKDHKDKSGTIKKKPSTSSQSSTMQHTTTNNTETTKITNNIQTTNTDSAHTTDDANNLTLKTKESVEDIWATLDENIQATAHEVTRKAESKKSSKASTACGTSSKSASVERQENDSRQSQAREIGTSPPPQSISTQESDLYKHTTEELNAALKYCGPDMHPLVWLRDNWPKLIQTVQSLATKYGQERAENTIGTISQMEARDALRLHTGNIWQAVSECIEQRQRKYRDISSKGNFSREDIVTALTTHQGNVELALLDLSRTQLKPFLMRIWGSPGGVENESGSLPLSVSPHSSTQSTHYNMDKASTTIANELETENDLPELPAEVVVVNSRNAEAILEPVAISQSKQELPTTSNKQSPTTEVNSSDSTKEIQIEDQSTKISDDLPSTIKKQQTETEALLSNQEANLPIGINIEDQSMATSEDITSTINTQQTETQTLSSSQAADSNEADFASVKNDMPSTSNVKTTSLPKPNSQRKVSEANNDNLPSTSKGITSSENKKKSNEEVKPSVKKPLTASKIPKPKEMPKETKTKETTTAKPQNEFKKKLYTRSKSFSGPTTPIGIASVKTISQKFISPTLNAAPTPTPKVYPTVKRKSSIVEAINKLTRPTPSSTEKPAVSSLFKSRTQPRIPKKKYHETCFSDDDYESSSEEEELEPLEIRQRKLSVPVFRAYPSVQEQVQEEVNTEELVQKFMKEELTATIAEAQIAAALVSMKFQQDVSLWAAKECSDLDHAVALLKQECELCSGTYALNQIVSMLKCTHKCCKQCAKTYFTVQITERSINDCSCPFCKLPELHNQTEHEDENLEYFSNLDIFLKNILEPEVHELFQRKLRDRTLLKDPNFKWCVQCSSGFFARPKQKRLICPDCGSVTCAQCRKTWQKQHEGISCDQYSEWESANDPEVQAKGVQQHLEQNGIDCPKCKFRYSLARGGCMHFTCTQCKYEFCYGCAKPFMMGAKCNISPYCAKLGLHAHHPRNCLFYLRDKLPIQLQILLKNNAVPFEVDPIETPENSVDDNEPSSSKKKELLCPIPIQKETPTGLVDTRCNGDVPEKHAGMCRTHYVEYLTAKVAKAKIDPLPIFDLTDCVQELRRRGIALPERGPWDTDEIYKTMCAEVIQKNIPLDMA
ncbi:E3 ubiquitin-protein ligase lubel isoform X9 [Lucilia sericata]|uniref:E3 ubiquitin-protein ligase lubel isoform X9 n=1 Tax=Lucilia sericata TaxID=13632 RepID=UPI0018A81688|nr:E3 ubiquitin-protein ligase lubel isoform X9 [Lucilia sericata]